MRETHYEVGDGSSEDGGPIVVVAPVVPLGPVLAAGLTGGGGPGVK